MKNKSALPLIPLLFSSIVSFAQFTTISNSPVSSDGLESKGVAWVDYDNDGDDDLFVTTSYHDSDPRKNLLYENNGDGTFSKIITGDLVNVEATGRNSTWADFNNDGLLDVVIVNQHENFLYKNSGGGVFTKQLSIPSTDFSFDSDHSGAAWGDYNGDGYVDLFLSSIELSDNARNVLYLNNKDESFTQIPDNNIVSTKGKGTDPAWIDYNNDGTLDLFVPNYCETNFLYSNQGNGNFNNVTNNVLLSSNCSVGSSWADYDNDGDFDVFIQNNVNQPNQFFENNGDGSFTEKFNATTTHTSSSAAWGDFDNDGFIDLVSVGSFPERKTYLYKNNGDKSFTDVSDQQGITNANYSWGVAWADYDKDGFLDFFIANSHAEPPFSADDILYHNTPNGNGWINIKLKGSISNYSAIGAVVKIKAAGKWQYRTVQSKTGNNSESSLNVHFGIGQAEKIDSLLVTWPDQGHQVLLNLAKNSFIEIIELNCPKTPSTADAQNVRPGEITLNWIDNSSNETGFRIERSTGSPDNFKVVGEVSANETSFTDKNLQDQDGITYYYRLASTVDGGYSLYSDVILIVTKKKQVVTFEPIGLKTLESPPFQLAATSSSGLPVSFRIIEGSDKVELNGSEITILSLGLSKIGAFQKGDDAYHASDTVEQTLDVNLVTGIEDLEDGILVYPNPVSENLIVANQARSKKLLKIVDARGQIIYSAALNSSGEESISFKEFSPGLYILFVDDRRIKVVKR